MRGPARQAEGRAERVALGVGQRAEAIEHRPAQLMQPGEGELHLGVDADGAGDAQVGCRPGHVLEQRGLPHARLAAEHEHAALTGAHAVEQGVEGRALAATTAQRVRRVGHGRPSINARRRPIRIGR